MEAEPSLHEQIGQLNETLANLDERLQGALTREEAQQFAEQTQRIRRRVTFTILASVLIAFILTLTSNNYAVAHCFLGTNYKHSIACNAVFPGYNASVDTNNERLGQFEQLLRQIKTNQDDIRRLEKQIVQLQHGG